MAQNVQSLVLSYEEGENGERSQWSLWSMASGLAVNRFLPYMSQANVGPRQQVKLILVPRHSNRGQSKFKLMCGYPFITESSSQCWIQAYADYQLWFWLNGGIT